MNIGNKMKSEGEVLEQANRGRLERENENIDRIEYRKHIEPVFK